MKKILLLSLSLFGMFMQQSHCQDAPVTYAAQVTCDSGTYIDVPVTVTNFNNIGALSLTLKFDSLVLDYQSYTNNSDFPGLMLYEQTTGKITAGGMISFGDPGINLSDNSVLFTLTFYCIGGSTNLQWFDNGVTCEYTDDIFNPLNDSPTCLYYKNGSVNDNSFQLELKIFLEGPFVSGEMLTTLRDMDIIPTSQPYSGSPWNYDGSESVSEIPENVIDWVLVELRESSGDASSATPDKTIARQAGFLMKDGLIKNASDCNIGNLKFSVSYTDNLYAVIYHRNHIAVISANPIIILNGNGVYDFSSAESRVLGGSSGHKELAVGIWSMVAGDSNADGSIDELDKQNDWVQQTGLQGYLLSDFSLNSQSDNIDKNGLWSLNLGFKSQVPVLIINK